MRKLFRGFIFVLLFIVLVHRRNRERTGVVNAEKQLLGVIEDNRVFVRMIRESQRCGWRLAYDYRHLVGDRSLFRTDARNVFTMAKARRNRAADPVVVLAGKNGLKSSLIFLPDLP